MAPGGALKGLDRSTVPHITKGAIRLPISHFTTAIDQQSRGPDARWLTGGLLPQRRRLWMMMVFTATLSPQPASTTTQWAITIMHFILICALVVPTHTPMITCLSLSYIVRQRLPTVTKPSNLQMHAFFCKASLSEISGDWCVRCYYTW